MVAIYSRRARCVKAPMRVSNAEVEEADDNRLSTAPNRSLLTDPRAAAAAPN